MAEVINSLFGVTPESLMADREARLQAQAMQYAQADPFQRATAGIYAGANKLGGAIGGMLGAQDPEMQKVAALQNIMKQANTTTPEGLATLAQTLGSQGFGQQAMVVMDQARQAQLRAAQTGKAVAEQKKVELTTAQEEKLRAELTALGPDATEEQYLQVVRKYGDPDKIMTSIQTTQSRKDAADAKIEAAKVAAQNRLDVAAQQGATQLQIAQMAAQSRQEIAQMQAEARRDMASMAAAMKGEKPLTEFQGKSVTFGTRAAQAHNILNDLEGTYSSLTANYLPSFVNSPEGQKAKQAQDNFVNAVLRQESGAAINASEFNNAKKQYFPQPGDSQQVLEQKRQNRETVIKGFARQAGPGGADVNEALKAPVLNPQQPSAVVSQIPTARTTPAAQAPVYAVNPTTKQRIMSTDGGTTWTQAR